MQASIRQRGLCDHRPRPQTEAVKSHKPKVGKAAGIGTLPRVGALDRLRAANGDDGLVERLRTDTRLLVAVVGATLLIIAWIAWAIYVASSDGARAGLGVVIAWPAMLAALAIISLPFVGGYLLIRRLTGDGNPVTASAEEPAGDDEDEGTDDG